MILAQIHENQQKAEEESSLQRIQVQHFSIGFEDDQFQKTLVGFNKPGAKFQPIMEKDRSEDLSLALFCGNALVKNPEMIGESKVLKAVIDYQFEQKTFDVFKKQFIVFGAFYFLPILVVFTNNDLSERMKQILMTLSLLTSILFSFYEYIQFSAESAKEYFSDVWNIVDILGYISYWTVCFSIFSQYKSVDTVMRVIVILQILLKINFFLRIFSKYGLLVSLIQTCFVDMIPFVNYLFIWLLCYVMLYIQTGIIAPERASLPGDFITTFIFVWENSIGNIDDPADESFQNDPTPLQVTLMWSVWFMNQFTNVIILLNFLIAVIS